MSNPAKLIETLGQYELFEDFDAPTVAKFIECGRSKSFAAGRSIVEESSLGDDFYIILMGRVSISVRGPSGNPIEVARLKDGDVIGETVLLGKVRRQASVIARDSVDVFVWKETAMIRFLKENPQVGFKFMRNLARILSDKMTNTNMMFRNQSAQNAA
jgi:CRP-like cAMP-binding protein